MVVRCNQPIVLTMTFFEIFKHIFVKLMYSQFFTIAIISGMSYLHVLK